ncbi:Cytochrome P450 [Mycena venus]|uniref:Cytochrome P450 n=1 Tax=Mycena venus TaxID=2733690 RepID=A0A8H6XWZ7_9AGAR|nr:Cytochrome P450 [Mycena venus]
MNGLKHTAIDRPPLPLYELLGWTRQRNLFASPTEKHGAVLSKFTTSPPGGTPIDFFPPLRYFPSWFPGAHYAGVARAWRPVVRKLYDYPLECVQRQREAGDASPSFLLSQLEEMDNNVSEINYEELKGAAATLFGAELPTRSANYRSLSAYYRETLRWNPVAPLGVPHRSTQDDVYRGMYIPKGSLILANVRGMSLDESTYENPTKFIPERFLLPPLGSGEPHFSCLFGFGRRKCPAVHFVERNLWIAIVSILATCTISNALDEHGNVIVPEASMSDGVDSYPKDLRCVIKPRFKEVEALLEESIILSPTT